MTSVGAPFKHPTVTVVVPTRNSARTLARCLESLRAQTHACTIVVVDNGSTDGTREIAERLAHRPLQAGPERSRQRNVGAAAAPADILGFVDSDMVVPATVVAEAVAALTVGVVAVVVPERSTGAGYWARVRDFERSFYAGSDGVEAARFFAAGAFDAVGGFDEALTGPEDWDLTRRTRGLGPVGRTASVIEHDEGGLRFRAACAKKAAYAEGLATYARRYGRAGLIEALDRPYLRRPWRLVAPHPALGLGVVALKAGEAAAVGWSLVWRSRP